MEWIGLPLAVILSVCGLVFAIAMYLCLRCGTQQAVLQKVGRERLSAEENTAWQSYYAQTMAGRPLNRAQVAEVRGWLDRTRSG